MDFMTLALAMNAAKNGGNVNVKKNEEVVLSGIEITDVGLDLLGFAFRRVTAKELNGFVPVYGEKYRIRIGNKSWDCYCRTEMVFGNETTLGIGNVGLMVALSPELKNVLPDTGEDVLVYMEPTSDGSMELVIMCKDEGPFSISVIRDEYITLDNRHHDFLDVGKVIIPTTAMLPGIMDVSVMAASVVENPADATGTYMVGNQFPIEGKIYKVQVGEDVYYEVCRKEYVAAFETDCLVIGNSSVADKIPEDGEQAFCIFSIDMEGDKVSVAVDFGGRNSVCVAEQDTIKPEYLPADHIKELIRATMQAMGLTE